MTCRGLLPGRGGCHVPGAAQQAPLKPRSAQVGPRWLAVRPAARGRLPLVNAGVPAPTVARRAALRDRRCLPMAAAGGSRPSPPTSQRACCPENRCGA
jgi:hypothetical protein